MQERESSKLKHKHKPRFRHSPSLTNYAAPNHLVPVSARCCLHGRVRAATHFRDRGSSRPTKSSQQGFYCQIPAGKCYSPSSVPSQFTHVSRSNQIFYPHTETKLSSNCTNANTFVVNIVKHNSYESHYQANLKVFLVLFFLRKCKSLLLSNFRAGILLQSLASCMVRGTFLFRNEQSRLLG